MDLGDPYYAPKDSYDFSAFVFVIDRNTNKSVPILSFEVRNTWSGNLAATSKRRLSRNEFTYNAGNGPTTVGVESNTINATIQRSAPALAFTYSLFAINWILTVCSLITTSFTAHRESEIGVALLPITVILTIPTIRGIYVDLPFGVSLGVYRKHHLSLNH